MIFYDLIRYMKKMTTILEMIADKNLIIGDKEKAISVFNTIHAFYDGDDHEMYYYYGIKVFKYSNENEQALSYLKTSKELGNPNCDYWIDLLYDHCNIGDEEYINHFQEKVKSKNAIAMAKIGVFYHKHDDIENALKYFKMASSHGYKDSLIAYYLSVKKYSELKKYYLKYASYEESNLFKKFLSYTGDENNKIRVYFSVDIIGTENKTADYCYAAIYKNNFDYIVKYYRGYNINVLNDFETACKLFKKEELFIQYVLKRCYEQNLPNDFFDLCCGKILSYYQHDNYTCEIWKYYKLLKPNENKYLEHLLISVIHQNPDSIYELGIYHETTNKNLSIAYYKISSQYTHINSLLKLSELCERHESIHYTMIAARLNSIDAVIKLINILNYEEKYKYFTELINNNNIFFLIKHHLNKQLDSLNDTTLNDLLILNNTTNNTTYNTTHNTTYDTTHNTTYEMTYDVSQNKEYEMTYDVSHNTEYDKTLLGCV